MADKKEILFDPFDKQLEFIEAVFSDEYKFILYGGAIRGGKTYALLGCFLILARIYPGCRLLVVRKDLQRIKNTVLPTFYQLMPTNFTAQEPSQSNNWEWVASNGSVIKFFAENIDKDPELKRFRGLEYDSIGFEEMDISKLGFEIGLQRCGTWKMKERKKAIEDGKRLCPSVAVGTSNPQHGWVKKDIYNKWKDGTLNKRWHYIPSRVYDNPYVSQSWIQDQKDNLAPAMFKMMVDGDWTITLNEQPFFPKFKHSIHVAPNLEIDPMEPLWMSYDFNVNPCSLIIGQRISYRGCYILASHQQVGGTEALVRNHAMQYLEHPAGLLITGDFSGNQSSTVAGQLPNGVFHTDFSIIQDLLMLNDYDMINTRTANHKHEYSRRLCNHFLAKVPFKIDSKCDDLIKEITIAQQTEKGKLLKDRRNFPNDLTDCFRYLISAWFQGDFSNINNFYLDCLEARKL